MDPINQPQPQTAAIPPIKEPLNAMHIILQWLTYAFWGWTVVALSTLTATVLYSFIGGNDTDGFTPYAIAAVLVLLPISFICDLFYSKHENRKKVGVELLVMVIHAVIFALLGIGSLIYAVFALVQMFTSTDSSNSASVGLFSALIIAMYYALTFLRTVNPQIIGWIQNKYRVIMLVTVGLIALLGIIGPVAQERATKNDRLIEDHLSILFDEINDYNRSNKKLPSDLNALRLNDDSKQLVDLNLVTYKPEGTVSKGSQTGPKEENFGSDRLSERRYQLCARYLKQSNNYRSSYSQPNEYTSYVSNYDHPAGEVCYKLNTTDY